MQAKWAGRAEPVRSLEDFDAIVTAIRQSGQPTMVYLEAEDGSVLVCGVGAEESVLTYFRPDSVSYHSLGTVYRKGHFKFLNMDLLDDFALEMAIPEETALTAARHFIRTGERPPGVRWEADWDLEG